MAVWHMKRCTVRGALPPTVWLRMNYTATISLKHPGSEAIGAGANAASGPPREGGGEMQTDIPMLVPPMIPCLDASWLPGLETLRFASARVSLCRRPQLLITLLMQRIALASTKFERGVW